METKQHVQKLTTRLEDRFRSSIEGMVPDLLMGSSEGGVEDEVSSDDFDSIYDYAADKALDVFPNVETLERNAMARRIAIHFCGEQQ